MRTQYLFILLIALLIYVRKPASGQTSADTCKHAELSVNAGMFNVLGANFKCGYVQISYYSTIKIWIFNLTGGGFFNTSTSYYLYAGLYFPVDLGRRLYLRAGFAPGFYSKGAGFDLGYPLEFITDVELGLKLKGKGKLGIGFSHLSNGGLSSDNPGIECLAFTFTIPMIFKQ